MNTTIASSVLKKSFRISETRLLSASLNICRIGTVVSAEAGLTFDVMDVFTTDPMCYSSWLSGPLLSTDCDLTLYIGSVEDMFLYNSLNFMKDNYVSILSQTTFSFTCFEWIWALFVTRTLFVLLILCLFLLFTLVLLLVFVFVLVLVLDWINDASLL